MIKFIDLFGNKRTKHVSDEMHQYISLLYVAVCNKVFVAV